MQLEKRGWSMKAMLLAAGLGTRLKPWTDQHPKALALVNGRSLLQRNIEYLQSFGIKDVIINVHHFADQIIHALRENKGWGSNITISDERDAVLETGGGLKLASWFFENESCFALMNVDVLTDLALDKMIDFHLSAGAVATLATTHRNTSRYFLFNEDNLLCGWRNIKTGDEKIPRQSETLVPRAFSGIHVINPKVFAFLQSAQTKFSMVDLYLSICNTENIFDFEHEASGFIDAGNPATFNMAQILFPY
jgi:MurNAc alpha-1-phosphate uridylyltransferase